ncbi:mycofactocin-coupled SDR family oxidoreductase [Rhodococcus sp. IEGM 1366]|uniref:mycofactocin-coupled SDR family oxidoreductase n=1 Tax=Rhodococcus sp. IEGM 1366 TaxID=3082223 RepID=UPI002955B3C5|nr:mycofactocin-coupled SDR family oxidoreductase [Rhodococcus sp. IEGM 1366]MDV8070642.1 mycofactocin-coupled SDR family oxidoreductase [Rhodococcus sp. IEGM 1366]
MQEVGKVALVTGAARGQGRSHAVALAAEGADVVLVDICRQLDTCSYPLSTPEDLAETVAAVEAQGRKAVPLQIDVRDRAELDDAVDRAVGTLGRLDVVVANAAISPLGAGLPITAYTDTLGIVFGGVVNTIGSALKHLESGASIIVIGSTAALRASTTEGVSRHGHGGAAYSLGKQMLPLLVHDLAYQLGPRGIRVNAVHPSNTNTDLLHNEAMYRAFVPGAEHPTREQAESLFPTMQRMPVPFMEPSDITAAVKFLASDEARYITGQNLAVDGGALLLGT